MGGNHTVPAALFAAMLVLTPTAAAAGTSVSLYTTAGEISITIDSPDPEEEEEGPCDPHCFETVSPTSDDQNLVVETPTHDVRVTVAPNGSADDVRIQQLPQEAQQCLPQCFRGEANLYTDEVAGPVEVTVATDGSVDLDLFI